MSESLVHTKEALEKAAASPDPAVRMAATRYYKLQQELHALDGFFTFYSQAYSESAVQAPARAKPAVKTALTLTSRAGMDAFIRHVCELLRLNGQPVRMKRLYDSFYESYPNEDKVSEETFRQRLVKKRHLVQLIEHRGYWPADTDVPEATDMENELAA
jgi:hypothetical protein